MDWERRQQLAADSGAVRWSQVEVIDVADLRQVEVIAVADLPENALARLHEFLSQHVDKLPCDDPRLGQDALWREAKAQCRFPVSRQKVRDWMHNDMPLDKRKRVGRAKKSK
jgi:hypothetical protein